MDQAILAFYMRLQIVLAGRWLADYFLSFFVSPEEIEPIYRLSWGIDLTLSVHYQTRSINSAAEEQRVARRQEPTLLLAALRART